jgi:hypothetical protein
MMKFLIFVTGVACGFAICSFLSEEQRERIRERGRSLSSGPRTQRLQSAAKEASGSVADVAVTAVEEVADRVSNVAGDVTNKISSN